MDGIYVIAWKTFNIRLSDGRVVTALPGDRLWVIDLERAKTLEKKGFIRIIPPYRQKGVVQTTPVYDAAATGLDIKRFLTPRKSFPDNHPREPI